MKKTKLIVVGDPHIGPEPGESRGVNTAVHLQKLVTHVNIHHPDAAASLFIGDLTHEGQPKAYEHFKELISPLEIPAWLMIGNHDHRQNFQTIFPEAALDSNGFVQFVQDIGNYRLIALDSLNGPPYDSMRRHAGFLCEKRLTFLESALKEAGEKPIIIAMHHQPFQIGLPGMDVIRLINGTEFLDVVNRFSNVKMLLMGHNHRSISGVLNGLPFSCFKSLSVQTPLDFEAVDPSGGIVEPPAYGVLLLGEDGIIVHQEEFMDRNKRFSNWEAQKKADPQMAAGFEQFAKTMLT